MTESIKIRNYADTLYFSTIDHDTFCEYRLPGHGLMWVRSGRMEIESKEGTIVANAGQFIFWQRDCSSMMKKFSDGDKPFLSIAITLPKTMLKEYFNSKVRMGKLSRHIKPIGGVAVLLPATITLESLFSSLLPYADSGIDPSADTVHEKVMTAIDILLKIDDRFYPTLFDFYETWKIDLYDFMKAHFTEDMSIEEFAHYSGRSLATFKRDFTKISDMTPQKWLIDQRLNLAARLLTEKEIKPSEIVYKIGFTSKAHFFRSFKQKFSCTPSQYVNQTKNRP